MSGMNSNVRRDLSEELWRPEGTSLEFCRTRKKAHEARAGWMRETAEQDRVREVIMGWVMQSLIIRGWCYCQCDQKSLKGWRFSSVQSLSCIQLFVTPWTTARRPPYPSPTPGVHPNAWPSSRWCHPTISSSVISFSSCPQSFPASGSFQMSQLPASGGQIIGVWASASVLPMNVQDCFPLGWTGWISLQPRGLSRVFLNITVQKHQFFGAQLSL